MGKVFIIGAGFSKAIFSAMPTTDELGKAIIESLEKKGRPIPPETRQGHFEEWLSRLAVEQPDLREDENYNNRGHFASIAGEIGEVLAQYEESVLIDDNWLTGWLNRFVTLTHVCRATVISYNYDTLIERATDMVQPLDFVHNGMPVLSSDAIKQFPQSISGPQNPPYSTFRLLKMHGSLDCWWVPGDITGGTISRLPLDGSEHPNQNQNQYTKDPRKLFFPSDAIGMPQESESDFRSRIIPGRSRFIIPPTALKSAYYNNPITRELWIQAREAIRNATEICIIGYSLPRTDFVTQGMLKESVNKEAKISVVNICPEPVRAELERSKIAEPNNIAVVHDIKDWISEQENVLSSQTPAKVSNIFSQNDKKFRGIAINWGKDQFSPVLNVEFSGDTLKLGIEGFFDPRPLLILARYGGRTEEDGEVRDRPITMEQFFSVIGDKMPKSIVVNYGSTDYQMLDVDFVTPEPASHAWLVFVVGNAPHKS